MSSMISRSGFLLCRFLRTGGVRRQAQTSLELSETKFLKRLERVVIKRMIGGLWICCSYSSTAQS